MKIESHWVTSGSLLWPILPMISLLGLPRYTLHMRKVMILCWLAINFCMLMWPHLKTTSSNDNVFSMSLSEYYFEKSVTLIIAVWVDFFILRWIIRNQEIVQHSYHHTYEQLIASKMIFQLQPGVGNRLVTTHKIMKSVISVISRRAYWLFLLLNLLLYFHRVL